MAIKTHFYEKTGEIPIANSVLKNALVIPKHELKPNVGYLDAGNKKVKKNIIS